MNPSGKKAKWPICLSVSDVSHFHWLRFRSTVCVIYSCVCKHLMFLFISIIIIFLEISKKYKIIFIYIKQKWIHLAKKQNDQSVCLCLTFHTFTGWDLEVLSASFTRVCVRSRESCVKILSSHHRSIFVSHLCRFCWWRFTSLLS
jgi:predicted membrane protein